VTLGLVSWLALDTAIALGGSPGASESGQGKLLAPLMQGAGQGFFWTPGSISRLIQQQPLEPIAAPRKYRSGPGTFRTLAPPVVVIRGWHAHGTGFAIDSKGLVLTNNHVVEDNSYVDPKGPSSYMQVDFGKLQDTGAMKRLSEEARGYVVAVDPERDLALLKLDHVPKEVGQLPTVPMADNDPAPGAACAMIGHPASGMLWTYCEGQVSALGRSPWDMVDFVLPMLHASSDQRAQIVASLDTTKSVTVVLTSCLANPGDSGGPLVDADGHLIGVTFAVPRDVSKRVLTYHVALSEVKAFLADVQESPILLVPDAWHLDPELSLPQSNILFAQGAYSQEVLLDLDADTSPELIQNKDFGELVGKRRFDAEVAIHAFRDRSIAFYDTDNDSKMDVILVNLDSDSDAEQRYTLHNGKWRFEDHIKTPFLDPSLCGANAGSFRAAILALRQLK